MNPKDKSQVEAITKDLLAGDDRALSRGLSYVEAGGEFAEVLLANTYPSTGRAQVVGITGSPGSGKSTLTRALAKAAREIGLTVGIIAVDPSSPFSGGSILGDRIRMNDIAVDLGVFVRSLATHGAMGGLSRAATDSIDLMDAAGRELILVETVGVGQDEIEVMRSAHTVVVVSVPGLGDEIQTLKAGILEISDIHVVNKADRDGADRVAAELRSMLMFDVAKAGSWRPPILSCAALREEGIEPVLKAIIDHAAHLKNSGKLEQRRKEMARARLFGIVRNLLDDASARKECNCDDLIEGLVARKLAPHAGGRELLARLAQCQGGGIRDV
jgi:LAO/AO transport system kinase